MEINYNLITIKCVLFTFFAGLGCVFPFLPLHMLAVGLTSYEARIICIVAPLIALLGPVIVGPIADKLAGNGGNSKNSSGKYLRIMTAAVLILGAIFYLLLMTVPTVIRFQTRTPMVSFIGDASGGLVLQERCTEEKKCHLWNTAKKGSLQLSDCRYTCYVPPENQNGSVLDNLSTSYPDEDISGGSDSEENDDDETSGDFYSPVAPQRRKRQSGPKIREPPHLCYKNDDHVVVCQVYTENSKNISINVSLLAAINEDKEKEWCRYPIGGYFVGRVNSDMYNTISNSCQLVIQCDVDDPYDSPESILAESQCMQEIGDSSFTFWSYLIIRSVADIFPTTAIVLLDAAIIIATRETSTGRGDVGIQLAWGTLGFAIFAPLVGYLTQDVMPSVPPHGIAIIMFTVLMVIAALILIFSNNMPLSPPEWWWHTKCGMLAMPMSAVRHYGLETGALLLVLMLLGVFWSALDTYLPWHLTELSGSPLLIGLTVTMGALPAVPVLWHAEKIVDYCGHSNLLITAFIFYIVRYTGLSYIDDPWWVLICEALEVFTLILMWITGVLYLRHLIPRRLTVIGQALPVIAHFCLGRFIGAVIGSAAQYGSTIASMRCLYRSMAIAAAVIASLYFLVYHFLFKPRCVATNAGSPRTPPTVMQGMNGNGSYTPLRIYHNGRARKGQFRY